MKILQIIAYILALVHAHNLFTYSHGIDSYFPEDVYVKILYKAHPDSNWIYVPANARGRGLETSGGICPYGIEVVTAKNYKNRNFTLLGSFKLSNSLSKTNVFFVSVNKRDGKFIVQQQGGIDRGWICENSNWVISSQGTVGFWSGSNIAAQL